MHAGLGRECGHYGLDAFVELKAIGTGLTV